MDRASDQFLSAGWIICSSIVDRWVFERDGAPDDSWDRSDARIRMF